MKYSLTVTSKSYEAIRTITNLAAIVGDDCEDYDLAAINSLIDVCSKVPAYGSKLINPGRLEQNANVFFGRQDGTQDAWERLFETMEYLRECYWKAKQYAIENDMYGIRSSE